MEEDEIKRPISGQDETNLPAVPVEVSLDEKDPKEVLIEAISEVKGILDSEGELSVDKLSPLSRRYLAGLATEGRFLDGISRSGKVPDIISLPNSEELLFSDLPEDIQDKLSLNKDGSVTLKGEEFPYEFAQRLLSLGLGRVIFDNSDKFKLPIDAVSKLYEYGFIKKVSSNIDMFDIKADQREGFLDYLTSKFPETTVPVLKKALSDNDHPIGEMVLPKITPDVLEDERGESLENILCDILDKYPGYSDFCVDAFFDRDFSEFSEKIISRFSKLGILPEMLIRSAGDEGNPYDIDRFLSLLKSTGVTPDNFIVAFGSMPNLENGIRALVENYGETGIDALLNYSTQSERVMEGVLTEDSASGILAEYQDKLREFLSGLDDYHLNTAMAYIMRGSLSQLESILFRSDMINKGRFINAALSADGVDTSKLQGHIEQYISEITNPGDINPLLAERIFQYFSNIFPTKEDLESYLQGRGLSVLLKNPNFQELSRAYFSY